MNKNNIGNMTLTEYNNTLNERVNEYNNFNIKYKSLIENIAELNNAGDVERYLKIIVDELFKEYFPPTKGRIGVIIDKDEYALLNDCIQRRRYRCHSFYSFNYFDIAYGKNKPFVLTLFKSHEKIYNFLDNMFTKLNELKVTLKLKNEEKVITRNNIDVNHLLVSDWSSERYCTMEKKHITEFTTIIVKETYMHHRNQKCSFAFNRTLNISSFIKSFLIDDECYASINSHFKNLLNKLDEMKNNIQNETNKISQLILDSEFSDYIVLAGI